MSNFSRAYREPSQCFSWPPFSRQEDMIQNHDHNAKEEVDAMLVESFTQLSFQERQTVQEDLHCVSKKISEDVDQMEIWLKELDDHLNVIKQGCAYETAEAMSCSYVSDRCFRVMFLRSSRYDPRAAAGQMIKFFELKLKLFCEGKLVRDITLNDLDDDEKQCLQNGSFQVLQSTDRANRNILFSLPGLRAYKTIENELRARFYLMMVVLQSQEAQVRGAIILTYSVGQYKDKLNGAGYVEAVELLSAVPLHCAGLHFCCDKYRDYILLHTAVGLFPAKVRARFKLHFGSHVECQYHLSTYGIPQETLPLDFLNNEANLDCHLRWCKERLLLQLLQAPGESTYSIEPSQNDVVFGGKMSKNGGNLHLRSLGKGFSHSYDTASKVRRRELIDSMINEIQSLDGRFLQQHEQHGPWKEVPFEEVHKKIAMMFRNNRRRAKRRAFSEIAPRESNNLEDD